MKNVKYEMLSPTFISRGVQYQYHLECYRYVNTNLFHCNLLGFLHLRLERFLLITLTFTTTQTLTYNTKKPWKIFKIKCFFFSNTQSDVFLQHLNLNLHSQTKLYCQFWYFWCSCPSNENFKDTLPIFIVKIYLTT